MTYQRWGDPDERRDGYEVNQRVKTSMLLLKQRCRSMQHPFLTRLLTADTLFKEACVWYHFLHCTKPAPWTLQFAPIDEENGLLLACPGYGFNNSFGSAFQTDERIDYIHICFDEDKRLPQEAIENYFNLVEFAGHDLR